MAQGLRGDCDSESHALVDLRIWPPGLWKDTAPRVLWHLFLDNPFLRPSSGQNHPGQLLTQLEVQVLIQN